MSRSTEIDRRVDLNLTPMIDVVFQLLAFFLMTFRVAAAEGDFDLKLPRGDVPRIPARGGAVDEIRIRLLAKPDGDLQGVQVDGQIAVTGENAVDAVHDAVARLIALARDAGQEEPPVVVAAADGLRYEHLLRVVIAVSQDVDSAGNVVPLARQVKFAPPR